MTYGPWPNMVAGGLAGAGVMMGFRYLPKRLRWLGLPAVVIAGVLMASYELAQLPDWPMHDFERDPKFYYGPAIIGMAGVFGVIVLIAERRPQTWVGGLAGAVAFPVVRLVVALLMFLVLVG